MSVSVIGRLGLQGRKLVNFRAVGITTSYRLRHFDPVEPYKEKNPPKDIWADVKDSKYTDVEEVTGHWHYVERLIPKLRILDPPSHNSIGPGWKAPPTVAPDLPYFVKRSRNHLLPVYQDRVYKARVLVTKVIHIQGDIWLFEEHLKSYLTEKHKKEMETQVNEIACRVNVAGDYIEDIKEWLYEKGF